MSIRERLNVPPIVNAAGTLTRLGGTLMVEPARRAMWEASEEAVSIDVLQARCSVALAELSGAEAGIVTSGCFAALALGTAACIAGLDVRVMNRLPRYGFDHGAEVVICRHHRNSYDRAFELSGASLIEVGYLDRYLGVGVREVEPEEIASAINDRTVAVAYVAVEGMGPSLGAVAEVARRAGVPVIVDAANQVPPLHNLRRFVADGADLVAMSGGKALRGPQASGFLLGRRDLVASALLQQLDMDVRPESWEPGGLIDRSALTGLPRHGFGRGFKIGKEEIFGAMAALLDFVEHVDRYQQDWTEQCRAVAAALVDLPTVTTQLLGVAETGRVPLLIVRYADGDAARSAAERLRQGTPPVFLNERLVEAGQLIFNPVGLGAGHEAVVARALVAAATP